MGGRGGAHSEGHVLHHIGHTRAAHRYDGDTGLGRGLLDELAGQSSHALVERFLGLAAQLGVLVQRPTHGAEHIGGAAQHGGHAAQQVAELVVGILDGSAGDGLDAAHSGGYGAFAHDFNHADITGIVYVCTAAELH